MSLGTRGCLSVRQSFADTLKCIQSTISFIVVAKVVNRDQQWDWVKSGSGPGTGMRLPECNPDDQSWLLDGIFKDPGS